MTVGTETDNGNAQAVYATIAGPGGALVVNNTNGSVVVRRGSTNAGSSLRATLNLSGLDMFTAAVGKVEIGSLGTYARPSGTLYLAKTNLITAVGATPAIQVGGQGGGSGNGGNGSFLYLGQSNAIFANGISVATVKQGNCSMLFNPAFLPGNPTALFRGADGVGPVPAWFIADSQSQGGTVNTTGTNDFSGGTVNALAGTLTVARSSTDSGTGNPAGTLTFSAGTISVGTLEIGYQGLSGGNFSTGVVNVNGTGLLVVSTNLELGHTIGGTGAAGTSGTLNINGGTVQGTNIFGGGGVSTINLNSGTLDLQAGNPRPGEIVNVSTLTVGAGLVENAALISVSNILTIASNGMIAGNTSITAPGLVVNGTISPGGAGVGAMTNSGPVTFGGGGNFALAVADAAGAAGSGWGFLQSGGAINAQSASTNPFTIQLQTLAGSQPGEAANFTYSTNYDWVVATAGGGVINFNAAKFAVEDAFFQNDLGGATFTRGPTGTRCSCPLPTTIRLARRRPCFTGRGQSWRLRLRA